MRKDREEGGKSERRDRKERERKEREIKSSIALPQPYV